MKICWFTVFLPQQTRLLSLDECVRNLLMLQLLCYYCLAQKLEFHAYTMVALRGSIWKDLHLRTYSSGFIGALKFTTMEWCPQRALTSHGRCKPGPTPVWQPLETQRRGHLHEAPSTAKPEPLETVSRPKEIALKKQYVQASRTFQRLL